MFFLKSDARAAFQFLIPLRIELEIIRWACFRFFGNFFQIVVSQCDTTNGVLLFSFDLFSSNSNWYFSDCVMMRS